MREANPLLTEQEAPALQPQVCPLVARLWPSAMLASPLGKDMLYTIVWCMGEGFCLLRPRDIPGTTCQRRLGCTMGFRAMSSAAVLHCSCSARYTIAPTDRFPLEACTNLASGNLSSSKPLVL